MPSGDGDTGADDAPEVTDTEDPDEELLAERADGYLDEFLGEGDTLEGEEEAGFADDQPVEAAAELRTPVRQGRSGPRSSGSNSSSQAAPTPPKASPTTSSEANRAQRRPRGNLPAAPVFDGDKKKDPKCFRKFVLKVDSYVEIAKNIIDESEIGLRLHAALGETPRTTWRISLPRPLARRKAGRFCFVS